MLGGKRLSSINFVLFAAQETRLLRGTTFLGESYF